MRKFVGPGPSVRGAPITVDLDVASGMLTLPQERTLAFSLGARGNSGDA